MSYEQSQDNQDNSFIQHQLIPSTKMKLRYLTHPLSNCFLADNCLHACVSSNFKTKQRVTGLLNYKYIYIYELT